MGGAAIDAYGTALRDEDLATCAAADAVLLGAVGGPKWDDPAATVRPEQGLLALDLGNAFRRISGVVGNGGIAYFFGHGRSLYCAR